MDRMNRIVQFISALLDSIIPITLFILFKKLYVSAVTFASVEFTQFLM